MATIKASLKILLFISIVLALGQVSISKKTVGVHFLEGVKGSSTWIYRQIEQSKFFAQIPIPDFIKKYLPVSKVEEPKKRASSEPEGVEEITASDRTAVLQILRN